MKGLNEFGTLSCEVLTELSEVRDISPEWDALLERSSCHRVFSSSAWFLGACSADDTISPQMILARRNGSIAGIFPLALSKDRNVGRFPSALGDYNDIVVAQDDVGAAASLLAHALSGALLCKRLVLSAIRTDANCLRAMTLLGPSRATARCRRDTICYYVPLPGVYERYLMARSRRFRKNLGQAERKATASRLVVRELDPTHFASSQLPDAFLRLHLERFQGQSCHESQAAQRFVSEVLPPLFVKRKLRAFALFEQDRMTAINLCLVSVASLCNWNGGFLPDAARWSPGNLLIAAGIRLACAMNFAEYDFLRGSEPYKESWATDRRLLNKIQATVS